MAGNGRKEWLHEVETSSTPLEIQRHTSLNRPHCDTAIRDLIVSTLHSRHRLLQLLLCGVTIAAAKRTLPDREESLVAPRHRDVVVGRDVTQP